MEIVVWKRAVGRQIRASYSIKMWNPAAVGTAPPKARTGLSLRRAIRTPRVLPCISHLPTGSEPARLGGKAPDEFRFYYVPESVLSVGDPTDRLCPAVPYPCATAEAALVHWIWLARERRLLPQSPESDVSDLDRARLCRLAAATGIEAEVRRWVAEAERYAAEVPDHCPGLGF